MPVFLAGAKVLVRSKGHRHAKQGTGGYGSEQASPVNRPEDGKSEANPKSATEGEGEPREETVGDVQASEIMQRRKQKKNYIINNIAVLLNDATVLDPLASELQMLIDGYTLVLDVVQAYEKKPPRDVRAVFPDRETLAQTGALFDKVSETLCGCQYLISDERPTVHGKTDAYIHPLRCEVELRRLLDEMSQRMELHLQSFIAQTNTIVT